MKVKTPVLDKLVKVAPDSQKIGEFLEWLSSQEIILAEWTGSDCDECGNETLMLISQSREQLLANYFCIDLVKAEKERKRKMSETFHDIVKTALMRKAFENYITPAKYKRMWKKITGKTITLKEAEQAITKAEKQ